MDEVEKYRGIYGDPRFARYGHTNHGAAAMPILEREPPTSILDIGCGWNEFAREWQARGLRAVGVDFACPGADLIGDLVEGLPYAEREWDLATAFDMLEHLRPEQIDAALREMARVSTRFLVSICYRDSSNRWQGETLHPCVRNEAWWIAALRRAGAAEIRKEGRYLLGRWTRPVVIAPTASVVLVGNGPALLAAEMGEAIDAHDVVVRFNDYRVAGYEDHVGTRTDLWSCISVGCENEADCPRALIIHEGGDWPTGITEAEVLPRPFYDRARRLVQDRAWIRSGCRIDPGPLLPSSGLLATLWMLDHVGVERVTLAGFDHFRRDRVPWHHYWLQFGDWKPPAEHDGDAEAAIFADLETAGRVSYL